MTLPTFQSRGNFVAGQWYDGLAEPLDGPIDPDRKEPTGLIAFDHFCPFDTEHRIGRSHDGGALVNKAVEAAKIAQRAWRRRPLEDRLALLDRFVELLDENVEPLSALITLEMGKPMRESRMEMNAAVNKWKITRELAIEQLRPHHTGGANAWYDYHPNGVFAVIGPFNFPIHLSNGHILPALVSGNSVILKPSEKAPFCGERYVQLFLEACAEQEAPGSLLQLLHGDGYTGASLSAHPGVDVVAFTGSMHVGREIRKKTATQVHKLLALEMGGKNAAIVLEDADLDRAARAITEHAFQTTGQRCTATSRVLVDQRCADDLIARVVELARDWRPDNPYDPATKMGPLISNAARNAFEAAQSDMRGLSPLVTGGAAPGPTPGYWVEPAVHLVRSLESAFPRIEKELFGPELLIERFSHDREAIHSANATPYGLSSSIFTADRERFLKMRLELDMGIVNLNRGTAGASSALPFGGVKNSGNHRPAGSFALRYCSYPVATIEADDEAADSSDDDG